MASNDYVPLNIDLNKGSDMLKKMQENQMEVLQEMIDDINLEIENRQKVSASTMSKLDVVIMDIDNQLLSLPKLNLTSDNQGLGAEIIRGMTELRKERINAEELKAQESINLWRDIANLKREQRLLIREFREKEVKDDILDDLIGA